MLSVYVCVSVQGLTTKGSTGSNSEDKCTVSQPTLTYALTHSTEHGDFLQHPAAHFCNTLLLESSSSARSKCDVGPDATICPFVCFLNRDKNGCDSRYRCRLPRPPPGHPGKLKIPLTCDGCLDASERIWPRQTDRQTNRPSQAKTQTKRRAQQVSEKTRN